MQYLNLGMKLSKVHLVLKSKQTQWIKPYLGLNTRLRQNALCKAEANITLCVSVRTKKILG